MEIYSFGYKVRLDDLDCMGIVANPQWMVFLERAGIDLLEKIYFPFHEMKKQKTGGVVVETNIKFLQPVFFGDGIEINIQSHTPFLKRLVLSHTVKNQHIIECLSAEIKIIFVSRVVNQFERLKVLRINFLKVMYTYLRDFLWKI